MKRVHLSILSISLILSFFNPVFAQVSNETLIAKQEFKPDPDIKKAARKYEKQGYYVAVGALPIERQLTNAIQKEEETDENGFPKYIIATGRSVGETQIAAKIQATEAAKLELAGTLATSIAALIENNISNAQLNREDAVSITQTVLTAKNMIAQEIGRVITLIELYRDIDKNIEANVRIAYNSEMAIEAAKKIIRKQLEKDNNLLQDKLDSLMKI